MSIESQSPIDPPLSMRDLTEVLVKHYGIHEGRYDLLVEFQVGMGSFGPTPETQCPGAMVSISRVGLMPSILETVGTVDAAQVNPKRKKSSRKKAD